MAGGDNGDDRGAREEPKPKGSPSGPRREPLNPGEIWKLILGTYKVSLPYLLVFLAGLLLATWILTELFF